MTGCFVPIRVLIASLMFGGTVISYVLRVNINIAIVSMTMDSEKLCVNMTSKDRCDKLRHEIIYILTLNTKHVYIVRLIFYS